MQPNISAVFPGQPIRLPPSVRPVPTLPEFQIEKIRCGDRSILVVREDLLAGGTKQRACVPYLEELVAEGVEEFVYASPFAGFAQVALAISARALGKKSTIFCERDATSPDQARFHEFSELARNHGARTVLVESLDHAIRDATCYAGERIGRAQLPLGFDCESFRGHLKREAARAWKMIDEMSPKRSFTLWVPVGSGTLLKTFDQVIPPEVRICGVNVRVLADTDPRIAGLKRISRCELFVTAERFEERSEIRPPVPSNVHYDAKLWRFMEKFAEEGDVWWNVAR